MRLKKLIVIAGLAIACSEQAATALTDDKLNGQLLKLDPATRLEQTCDTEVMMRINEENKDFKVDKVIAYSLSEPTVSDNLIKAPGAVLRSHGNWYRLSFLCETGPRHLDAHKLQYQIGPVIPREEWTQYYLYD
ncbi:DUF930 domain-containing protein [Rhizobium sp. NTR19]|uniref:DUF930 domain-containing protein n=1 Tax=Neorhizobium turbinariae TaxID=2937795 RepID=A0ABT0IPQ9_9HYPH|nr:DUF930 domain-containing protein [Neorhizobium turbinariae]MCK8779867.1 DUF930 domain-containing protein [Neorhizobium turbinariae]